MSRKEAINIISQMIKDEEGFLSDNTVEAHKMAIKALKQEPCEDCVNRQAVLKINESHHGQMPNQINHQIWQEIKELPPVTPKPTECDDAVSRQAVLDMMQMKMGAKELYKAVYELPSVTPQPKTGRWTNGDPICPCCGEDKFKDLDADIWADWQPKHCPNCGAKMVESEDKE